MKRFGHINLYFYSPLLLPTTFNHRHPFFLKPAYLPGEVSSLQLGIKTKRLVYGYED